LVRTARVRRGHEPRKIPEILEILEIDKTSRIPEILEMD
jgi:hypothetical protein